MEHTFIIGIDVASKKLDLCCGDEVSNLQYQTIEYTDDALEQFTASCKLVPEEVVIGLEATGDYHLKAARYFLKKGFTVKIINPILTKQYIRATIRGAKTDKKDSEGIWKLIRDGEGDTASLKGLMNREKELLRLSRGLVTQKTQLKQRLASLRRKELPNTEHVEQRLLDIISELDKLDNDIIAETTVERSENELFIESIVGFGVKLSTIVYHEIGDINRFKNVNSLVAFAGLDPKVRQSGASLNTRGRLSKRGSPILRHGLFLAANVARIYDDELRIYYDKKRKEGRSYREAICIISRKLLHRLFTVLKERRVYEKRKLPDLCTAL
jgi:transposase